MRDRLREWGWRYLPLEIVATLTALAGGLGAAALTANPVVVAYAGAWAENVGYYGLAALREMRAVADEHGGGVWARAGLAARRLIWEFGTAEVLDSFVVRPAAMLAATEMLGSFGWGIVAGKLAADAVFYCVAIVFYEMGKRR